MIYHFMSALLTVPVVLSKFLGHCELASELHKYGMPKSELHQWVCIAEHESNGNTARVRGPHRDGSFDYGLFLLNSGKWCSETKKGNACNMKCSDLISRNLTSQVRCARIVHSMHGFNAWKKWAETCKFAATNLRWCLTSASTPSRRLNGFQ